MRRSLSPAQRRAASRLIVRRLVVLRVLRPGVRVAIYLAMPGEVDLARAVPLGRRLGARLYAPRITSFRRRTMVFLPLPRDARHPVNSYGIAEPSAPFSLRSPLLRFDTVVLPLVGFDRTGLRLGMGGGFYDRALARRLHASRIWRRPRLVGVAFACQEVASIEPSSWDVRLDAVVTEREVIHCHPRQAPAAARSA